MRFENGLPRWFLPPRLHDRCLLIEPLFADADCRKHRFLLGVDIRGLGHHRLRQTLVESDFLDLGKLFLLAS